MGRKAQRARFGFMQHRDFPLIILAAGIILTVGIWDFTNHIRSDKISEQTRDQADEIRLQLVNYFSSYFDFLSRSAIIVSDGNGSVSRHFSKFCQSVFQSSPGILGVQLIDAQTVSPVWLEVAPGQNQKYFNDYFSSKIASTPEWQRNIQKAVERNKVIVSSPMDLYPDSAQTDWFVYAVYPVRDASARAAKFLVQYVSVKEALDRFFKAQNVIYYHYLVSYRWEILYSDLKFWHEVSKERPFKLTRQIEIADKDWFLNIWPREDYLADQVQYEVTSILILTMGLLLSISTALFAWSLINRQQILEKLVKIRTEQLEQVNLALKSKNEELETFLYVVSHDLKAPLVSIKGFTSLLAGSLREKLSDEEKHAVDRINANTSRMHEMIQDLLELSRVGRVEESTSDVDTGQIVRDILDEMKPILEQKHVQIELKGSFPVLQGSSTRFAQLFSNLIGNAVKYIGAQPQPKIEIGVTQSQDHQSQFYVRDNGPGIPKEYQEKIFMVFQRGPEQTKTEGTGIGLSIVKKIVESKGGKVWLNSEVGKGSTFFFMLPNQVSS
ncbi:MAG: GHKL domain-containing protein [Candidatus Omnitrophica bacterium]|nr:GHKL domain-containing protein [Candidatus Omnitrophota bacterium]